MRRRAVLIIALALVLSAFVIPVAATKRKHKKKLNTWPNLTTINVGNKMCRMAMLHIQHEGPDPTAILAQN